VSLDQELKKYVEEIKLNPDNFQLIEELKKFLQKKDEAQRRPLFEELKKLYLYLKKRGEFDTIKQLLNIEISLSKDPTNLAELYHELAMVFYENLMDNKNAKENLKKALKLNPNHRKALILISKIKESEEKKEESISKYLKEIKSLRDSSSLTTAYYNLAELYYRTDPLSRESESYLKKSLEQEPRNYKSAFLLSLILHQKQKWEELIDLYLHINKYSVSREHQTQALLRAARISIKLEQESKAAKYYAQAFELTPSNQEALSFLVDYFTRSENWENLIALYEKTLSTRPGGEVTLATLLQIGMLKWKYLNNIEEAEPYFRRVRKLDPTQKVMIDFYLNYYQTNQDWKRLFLTLSDCFRLEKDHQKKIEIATKMAEIAEIKLKSPEKSLDIWKEIFKLDPKNLKARNKLKTLYTTSNRWNALLEVLKLELNSLPDTKIKEKISLLEQIVEIYRDKLKLEVMVINTYNAILSLDPLHQKALETLKTKYQESKRWIDLIEILNRFQEAIDDPQKQKQVLQEIALIWIKQLGNYSRAISPAKKILEIDPTNLEAITILSKIYQKQKSWKELYQILEKKKKISKPEELVEILKEQAKIAEERLNLPKEAKRLREEILSLSPGDLTTLNALERLTEKEQEWPSLVQFLEQKIKLTKEEERIPIIIKIATVYQNKIKDLEKAATFWRQVLEKQPDHPKAFKMLKDFYLKTKDFKALYKLYEEREKWEELAQVLEEISERTEVIEEKVKLYFQAAQIYEEKTPDPSQSVKIYERILSIYPKEAKAAEKLVSIYRKNKDWQRLAETLQILLTQEEKNREIIEELRDIYHTKLPNPSLAFKYTVSLYLLSPKEELKNSLEKFAKDSEAWEELIQVYENQKEKTKAETEKRDLEFRIAKIKATYLQQKQEAISLYSKILEQEPSSLKTLKELGEIYKDQKKWKEYINILKKRAELEPDPKIKHELNMERAEIYEVQIKDLDQAQKIYERCLSEDPEDPKIFSSLVRIYTEQSLWQELASLLKKRKELVKPEERVELGLELAKVQIEKLKASQEAFSELREILQLSPNNIAAMEVLEGFLSQEEYRKEAAEILEPLYVTLGDYSKLAWILSIILEETKELEKRVSLFKRLSKLYDEKLGDPESTFRCYLQAFKETPQDPEILDNLFDFTRRLQLWEDCAAGIEEVLKSPNLPDSQVLALTKKLGIIYEEQLGRLQDAAECYQKVISLQPEEEFGYNALERIYTIGESWQDLLVIFKRRIETTSDKTIQEEYLFKLCFLFEEIIGDVDSAVKTYTEILRLNPKNFQAIKALERHYINMQKWSELKELLEKEVELVPQKEANELRYRIGGILKDKLKDINGAVMQYQAILRIDPNHVLSKKALEEFIDDPKVNFKVATILEPVYESNKEWKNLTKVLEIKAQSFEQPEKRGEIFVSIGKIFEERLSDFESTFNAYKRAFLEMPKDISVFEKLKELSETEKKWQELADIIQKGLSKVQDDPQLSKKFLLTLSEVTDVHLSQPKEAEKYYQMLIKLDTTSPETVIPASKALERIYTFQEAWTKLVDVLNISTPLIEDPSGRKENLFKIGQIYETRIKDLKGAISAYKKILELEPDQIAIERLEQLYEQTKAWKELIELNKYKIDFCEDIPLRRAIYLKIASIQEEYLKDIEGATQILETIIQEIAPDLETIQRLKSLYEQAERWEDILNILQTEIDLISDPKEQALLYFNKGEVLRNKLSEPIEAIKCYEQALSLDFEIKGPQEALNELLSQPEYRSMVFEILKPVYKKREEWDLLMELIEQNAQESEDLILKAKFYSELAEIAKTKLNDVKRAFYYLGRALKELFSEPEEARALLPQVEETAKEAGTYKELVDLIIEGLPDVLDGDLRLCLVDKVAELAYQELKDFELAEEYYERILEQTAPTFEILSVLEDIYTNLERWSKLLEIYRLQLEIETDLPKRKEILLKISRVCKEFLEDIPSAIEAYEAILEFEEDPEIFERLEELYTSQNRWRDLAELGERKLAALPEVDTAEFRHRLGEIWEEKLKDLDQAYGHYKIGIAKDDSYHPTIQALERLMRIPENERRGEIAQILEPIYRKRMEWERLINAIEIQIESIEDLGEKKRLFTEIATLYEEQLENLEGTFDTYVRLFKEDIYDQTVWDRLARLSSALENWKKLSEVYAKALEEVIEDTPETVKLCVILGRIFDERLEDFENAKKFYKRALEFEPDNSQIFLQLENLFLNANDWHELLELYQARRERTLDQEEKETLLKKIARIWEEELQDLGRAIEVQREVLEISPEDEEALERLENLLEREERWEELSEHLNRRIELTSGIRKAEFLHKLGEVARKHLKDYSRAVDSYSQVLEILPSSIDSIRALESLLEVSELRLRVAKVLEPIYKQREEWTKLIAMYEIEVEFSSERSERLELLKQIAWLYEEKEKEPGLVFHAYSRAFIEDPSQESIIRELERLAKRYGTWDEFIQTLNQGIEKIYDYNLKGKILMYLAEIYERERNDLRSAILTYKQLIQIDEENEKAINSLERLYTQTGDWEGVIFALEQQLNLIKEPHQRKELLYRIAKIYEIELRQPEQAIETYRHILDQDEEDLLSLESLERLYQITEGWSELIWVYRRRIEIAQEDPVTCREFYLRIAAIYEEKIKNPFEAISTYKIILDQFPEDSEAISALERLYQNEKLWIELIDLLTLKLSLAKDPREKTSFIFKIGQIFEHGIKDLERAIDQYQGILEESPDHEGAIDALEQIALEEAYRLRVSQILLPLYERANEWTKVINLRELRLQGFGDIADRTEELREIARIYEEKLNDLEGGFKIWHRALSENPENEEFCEELYRIAKEIKKQDQLCHIYEEAIEKVAEEVQVRNLNLRLARLYQELGKIDYAIDRYQLVLQYPGDEREVLEALDRLYSQTQNWPQLASILSKKIELLEGEEKDFCEIRLAQIAESKLNDIPTTLSCYKNILKRNPSHQQAYDSLREFLKDKKYQSEVIDFLEPLCQSRNDIQGLIELYELRLELEKKLDKRLQLYWQIEKLYREELNEAKLAFATLVRAFREAPSQKEIFRQLYSIAEDLKNWQDLIDITKDIISQKRLKKEVLGELNFEIGNIWQEEIKNPKEAEVCFWDSLKLKPLNRPALSGLEKIYREREEKERLREVLEMKIKTEEEPTFQKELLKEIGLLSLEIKDEDRAEKAFESVLEIDLEDIEVLRSLLKIKESKAKWSEFIKIGESLLGLTEDFKEVQAIRHQIGRVFAVQLDEPKRAIEVYNKILEEEPTDKKAYEALAVIFETKEKWEELKDILLRQLEITEEDAVRVPLLRQIAQVYEKRLDRPEEAIDFLMQILEREPYDLVTLKELERLFKEGERYEELINFYEDRINKAESDGKMKVCVDLLLKGARFITEELKDPQRASSFLSKALEIEGKNFAVLMELARVREALGEWEECLTLLQQALEFKSSDREAAEVLFMMGRIYRERMENESESEKCLLKALEYDPSHQGVTEILKEVYSKKGDYLRLAAILEYEEAYVEEKEEKAKIFQKIANIYINNLNSISEGISYLERALKLVPEHQEIMTELADRYLEIEKYPQAIAVLKQLVDRSSKERSKKVAIYHYKLGRAYEAFGEKEVAKEEYEAAYRIDLTYVPTLVRLGRLLYESGELVRSLKLFRALLLQRLTPETGITKVEIYYQIGQIYLKQGETKKALSMFQRGLDTDPSHEPTKKIIKELT
jgi:tetratricopeptide (TPR) repeat protein